MEPITPSPWKRTAVGLLAVVVLFGTTSLVPTVSRGAGPQCDVDEDCDDFNPCTTDACDDGTCFHENAPNFLPCPDAVFCDGSETCQNGACTPASPPCQGPEYCDEVNDLCLQCLIDEDCVDDNPCTVGECDGNTCVLFPLEDGTDCSDGLFCNGAEACSDGNCTSQGPPCGNQAGCDEIGESCIVRVDLEWRPALQIVEPGTVSQIGLYAVTSDGHGTEGISGIDAVLNWDATGLTLLGKNDIGTPWSISSFPAGPAGCDLNSDWTDGDALYRGLILNPNVPVSTPEGTLMTRFVFRAPVETLSAELHLAEIPQPTVCDTVVASGDVPGLDVTGTLPVARVRVTTEPYTPGDADGNRTVNLIDFDIFVDCTSGPDGGLTEGCRSVDFDLDVDVDLHDFAWFQRTMAGTD